MRTNLPRHHEPSLVNHSLSVLPVCGDTLGRLVISRETVDTALNKNEAELSVLILAVPVQMLADRDGLLDKHIQVLRELRGEALGLEDA